MPKDYNKMSMEELLTLIDTDGEGSPSGEGSSSSEGSTSAEGKPVEANVSSEGSVYRQIEVQRGSRLANILDLDEESLLKGIIFSEILGKPRSRRRIRR